MSKTKMMKKILGIIFLGLLLSGNAYAAEPSWDKNSLNINIKEHGWKVKSFTANNLSKLSIPIEIYTLTKDNWILKCTLIYRGSDQSGYCNLP